MLNVDQEDLKDLKTRKRMSRLINEDWEHAAYANDEVYAAERQYLIELECQEWLSQEAKNRKPAIIKVIKPLKDEVTHITTEVRRAHQKKL